MSWCVRVFLSWRSLCEYSAVVLTGIGFSRRYAEWVVRDVLRVSVGMEDSLYSWNESVGAKNPFRKLTEQLYPIYTSLFYRY